MDDPNLGEGKRDLLYFMKMRFFDPLLMSNLGDITKKKLRTRGMGFLALVLLRLHTRSLAPFSLTDRFLFPLSVAVSLSYSHSFGLALWSSVSLSNATE